MATLGIRNVHKAYGSVKVLQDIDIQVSDGEFLVLVGPSGCGKSTLLNMIAGLETVTGGTIEIEGVPVNDLPPAHRDIAMVFQSYALYPTMTVEQNMAFGLEMRGVSKADRKVAVQRRPASANRTSAQTQTITPLWWSAATCCYGSSVGQGPKNIFVRRTSVQP
jgi:multiple sugar transport system ATP-binding protein